MNVALVQDGLGTCLSKADPKIPESRSPFAMGWREHAQSLQREAHVLYLVFRHPRTPWYAKWVAAFPVAYLFSPVQLIPNFIPVVGFLDDFLVLLGGAKLIRRLTPADLLRECSARADRVDIEESQEIRAATIRSAIILGAATSLLAAFAASALIGVYIHH